MRTQALKRQRRLVHTCTHQCIYTHASAHPRTPARAYPYPCTSAHALALVHPHTLEHTPVNARTRLLTVHTLARQRTLIITLKVTHKNHLNHRKHKNFDFHKTS